MVMALIIPEMEIQIYDSSHGFPVTEVSWVENANFSKVKF
jgi:hypothetical protein